MTATECLDRLRDSVQKEAYWAPGEGDVVDLKDVLDLIDALRKECDSIAAHKPEGKWWRNLTPEQAMWQDGNKDKT